MFVQICQKMQPKNQKRIISLFGLKLINGGGGGAEGQVKVPLSPQFLFFSNLALIKFQLNHKLNGQK